MSLEGAGRNESLTKAFAVLGSIGAGQGAGVSTGAIVASTGLPRSTALRILGSLLELGAVNRLPDKSWTVGPTIGVLAGQVSPILRLRALIEHELHALSAAIEEMSLLAIPVGDTAARVLYEVEGPRVVGVRSRWADRVSDYSASGFVRTLLSELPPETARARLNRMEHPKRTPYTKTSIADLMEAVEKIRHDGHSAVINELEDGIAGVGVSVHDDGKLVAMLAVYLPSIRLTTDTHRNILEQLQKTSHAITGAL